jgi:hypothetical protein
VVVVVVVVAFVVVVDEVNVDVGNVVVDNVVVVAVVVVVVVVVVILVIFVIRFHDSNSVNHLIMRKDTFLFSKILYVRNILLSNINRQKYVG